MRMGLPVQGIVAMYRTMISIAELDNSMILDQSKHMEARGKSPGESKEGSIPPSGGPVTVSRQSERMAVQIRKRDASSKFNYKPLLPDGSGDFAWD